MVWSKLISLSLLAATPSNAFNLEARLPIIKKGEDGSKFGYTVATYKTSPNNRLADSQDNLDHSYIIVGAPQDKNGASPNNLLPAAEKPGAIHYCQLSDTLSRCRKISLGYSNVAVRNPSVKRMKYYATRPSRDPNAPFPDILNDNANATDQWLGASLVASTNEDGLIIACAPRWKQRSGEMGSENEEEKLGGQLGWVV